MRAMRRLIPKPHVVSFVFAAVLAVGCSPRTPPAPTLDEMRSDRSVMAVNLSAVSIPADGYGPQLHYWIEIAGGRIESQDGPQTFRLPGKPPVWYLGAPALPFYAAVAKSDVREVRDAVEEFRILMELGHSLESLIPYLERLIRSGPDACRLESVRFAKLLLESDRIPFTGAIEAGGRFDGTFSLTPQSRQQLNQAISTPQTRPTSRDTPTERRSRIRP